MKTHLAIQHIGAAHTEGIPASQVLVGLLVTLGALFGMLLGITLNERIPFPGTVREQLAAPKEASFPSPPVHIALPTGEVAGAVTTEDTGMIPATASEETLDPLPEEHRNAEIARLNGVINAHLLTITQIQNEIQLIKESSVALVATFDRNCGNWKDVCGAPFATELEASNTRYAVLVDRLNETMRLQKEAESERALYSND